MLRSHRKQLPIAIITAALIGLLVSTTAFGASTGRICGQLTAFTAPTLTGDGSLTINGAVEVVDSSAVGSLAAGTVVLLNALAAADATTCLDVTAAPDGSIIDISIAATAEVCGDVVLDTTTGVASINGVLLPTSLLSADTELTALLGVAIDANADICADLTIDTTTGLIVGVAVDADFNVCGAVDVDSSGNATVGGVLIPAGLIDSDAAAALRLAALVDANACANVTGTTTGTTTTVDVGVTATICATVTAIGTGTLTLEGITLDVVGDAAAGVEVGDEVCVAVAPGTGGGNPIIDVNPPADATPSPGAGGSGGSPQPGVGALPDTTMSGSSATPQLVLLALLAISGGVVVASRTRHTR